MRRVLTAAGVLLFAFLVTPAALAVEVRRSADVAAPPDEVWQALREFCSIVEWHPMIASCVREQEGTAELRVLMTEDDKMLREELIQRSEEERSYRYSILDSPLPVTGYVSTLSVLPADEEGRSVVIWQSQFSAQGVPETEAAAIVAGIYEAGLERIEALFE